MGKCVYCKCNIEDARAVDVCDTCGRKVWGDKMFLAIKQSMGDAKEKGNLEQGSINASAPPKVGKLGKF
jgi:hypothetical protein